MAGDSMIGALREIDALRRASMAVKERKQNPKVKVDKIGPSMTLN